MKLTEQLKLSYRANKYKNKHDKGGIKYMLQSIKTGQTVFDIGAHKGGYLYFILKKTGNEGKVYAFEPQSLLYNYLVKIKEILGWSNVTVEHMALSDKETKTTLFIPENKNEPSSPGATIVKPLIKNGKGKTEEVTTDTLDSYCNRFNIQPDFLKIDVEGNELPIFKGGIETLKRYKPKIFVECEARHVGKERVMETFKFLHDIGYSGSFIRDTDFFPLKDFNIEKHQDLALKPYCNNFIFE
jgi:FkbM family methyltransferase